jgi:hypothetical protein
MSACAPAPCGGAVCYAIHKKYFPENRQFLAKLRKVWFAFSVGLAGGGVLGGRGHSRPTNISENSQGARRNVR